MRASATSRGVAHIGLAAVRDLGVATSDATAAVQGFGKVGRGAAGFLHAAGVRVAVSDQYGAVFADRVWICRSWSGTSMRPGPSSGFPALTDCKSRTTSFYSMSLC
ncbi:hypothetical protein [Nocardia amamiensis]|uniref:hypothetical protein n=1 Tax=Nocardia amamiensis TaxID=404578 RepID=UPI000B04EFF1|nr:hypothetical protein [Nocardia amamiensis]